VAIREISVSYGRLHRKPLPLEGIGTDARSEVSIGDLSGLKFGSQYDSTLSPVSGRQESKFPNRVVIVVTVRVAAGGAGGSGGAEQGVLVIVSLSLLRHSGR